MVSGDQRKTISHDDWSEKSIRDERRPEPQEGLGNLGESHLPLEDPQSISVLDHTPHRSALTLPDLSVSVEGVSSL